MFASARAVAAEPLASPSLKHVFESAHTQPPLVGLGIHASLPPSSLTAIRCILGSSGSGQPMMHRLSLVRVQTPNMVLSTPPSTPRLQCAAVFPSVFSSALDLQSPLAEGYFSDDDSSTEIREELRAHATGSQAMNTLLSDPRQFAATTNTFRSTFRFTRYDAYSPASEVERNGLGISGLVFSSLNRSSSIIPFDSNEDAPVPGAVEIALAIMSSAPSTKLVRFNTRARDIRSPNEDGYVADAEHEDNLEVPSRQHRRSSSASTGSHLCKDRVLTPFYAPNGETSWP